MVFTYAHTEEEAGTACASSNASGKGVVLYFTASWCGPCKRIKPTAERLADTFRDTLDVVVIDVDEVQRVAELYKVKSMPTFVFCVQNKQVDEFSGASPDKLARTMEKLSNTVAAARSASDS